MHRLREWMTRHPWLCGATALVGFFWSAHEFLNWRTERDWQNCAAAARARGVKLQLTEFALPEISDAANFATLPIMRAAFAKGTVPFSLPKGRAVPGAGNAIKGTRIDWSAWSQFLMENGRSARPATSPCATSCARSTLAPGSSASGASGRAGRAAVSRSISPRARPCPARTSPHC
jgi:hypothetical protein